MTLTFRVTSYEVISQRVSLAIFKIKGPNILVSRPWPF